MSRHRPLVSVILPFLNAGAAFHPAVRSILHQSYTNLELLLCDDGSRDSSLEWARSLSDPRLAVWSDGKSKGLASRLNECIDRARGSLIARMDADDVSYPERLEKQVAFLAERPELDLAGCQMLVFGEDGQVLGKRNVPLDHAQITRNPALGFGLAHPTWLVRAEWYRKHYYNAKALRFEDAELLFRSHATSRFANLPDVLYGYRELRGGFRKRYETRAGLVRYLKMHRESLGVALYYRAAAAEAVKTILDAGLTGLSCRYLMLRVRDGRLGTSEIAEWQRIYDALSSIDPVTHARTLPFPREAAGT
jgi:glycosyltransferase involved in cell wall biosynthesis